MLWKLWLTFCAAAVSAQGYTSATFSGRCAMPLLADAIVECARRTLTGAIDLAKRWGQDLRGRWTGIDVLYGDTDSVFILVPGRSVHEAFQFGEEFCKAVTDSNPPPIALKLEKVCASALRLLSISTTLTLARHCEAQVYLGSMMQTV